MTTRPTTIDATAAERRLGAVSGTRRASMARDMNAVFAIAWREILRAVKSPLSIAFTVIFPILFIGILGGSISQNLGAGLGALGLAPVAEAGGGLRVEYRTPTAQDVIARIRTPLTVLRIREPSLEEAYIELLRDPEEAVA